MNNECFSAQSTPSDLRSICSSPDWMNGADPLHLPQLSTGGPQWNGNMIIFIVIYFPVLLQLLAINIQINLPIAINDCSKK